MKLGKDIRSVTNYLLGLIKNNDWPKVGDGATHLMWTDRHAYTVVAVDQPQQIVVLAWDKAVQADDRGMCDDQEYVYFPDASVKVTYIRKYKNSWYEVLKNEQTGRWNKKDKFNVQFGIRDEYYDYSF
jgi:hypothetical protein